MSLVLSGHPDVLLWHLEAAIRDIEQAGQCLWVVQSAQDASELSTEIRFAADPESFRPSDPLYVEEDWLVPLPDLPTIEQCREFLATINRGREAIDCPPLEYLDFDGAHPKDPHACLSATNLFAACGYTVGTQYLCPIGQSADERVLVVADPPIHGAPRLPVSIKAVTDPFDESETDEAFYAALRARLVEAGVVAP